MIAIQALRRLCDGVQKQLSTPFLFPKFPTINIEAEEIICSCGGQLRVQKTQIREKIVTLQIGQFSLHETVKHCPNCQKIFRNEGVKNLVPDFCNFGFDVIEHVGRSLFLEYRTLEEIVSALRKKNVFVSDREVSYLGRKFIYYLAQAQADKSPEIQESLREKGGYVLHFDATCDGDSPHLLCAIAEQVGLVLGSVKVPSETTEATANFLNGIKELYGVPLAGVCDMLRANLAAFEIVFPGIKLFICHFHFLRDIGKDLMEYDYSMLRDGLKRYGVNARLKEISRNLRETIGPEGEQCLEKTDLSDLSKFSNHMIAYVLVSWICDFKNELNGYGFPFDQAHLVRFQRMREAYQILKNIPHNEDGLQELKYFLGAVVEDNELKSYALRLQKKIKDFNQLRQAMRIALPNGKKGLNDDGTLNGMATIEKEVSKFVERDEIKESPDRSYQKMYKQIKKYWSKLFADPIDITLPNGEKGRIYPQRTNNILERFFREENRGNRKRNGNKSLGRTLQTMLAETPMVKNLNNPEYLKIILNGKDSLAELFSEIDSGVIRNKMENHQTREEKLPLAIKKIIRAQGLPTLIVDSVGQQKTADAA